MVDIVNKGRFAYIKGSPTMEITEFVWGGQVEILTAYIEKGDIEIVCELYSDGWLPENAQINMEQCLTANDNNVDAVVASNDGTAGGVVAALASQGLAGNIPVSGQDGDIAALNRIAKGYQTVSVYAMGGNPEAAELAGIDVKKMTLLIFVISGILCAIAGAVSIARLNASPTSLGQYLSRP